MIRFKEIWELYEKGKVKDEQPLKESEIEKEESPIIDVVSTSKTDETIKTLDNLDVFNPDFKSLENILEDIKEKEQNVRNFLNLNIPDHYIYGHIVRVIKTGDRYDNILTKVLYNSYDLFQESFEELTNAETLKETALAREIADKNYTECKKAFNLILRRELDIDKTRTEQIESYGKQKEKIEDISARIKIMFNRYTSLDLDNNSYKEIKKLRKRIKNSFLSKGEIIKDCNSVNYIEGLEKLNELREDMDYMIDNFEESVQVKENLPKDISKTNRKLSSVNNVSEDNLQYFKKQKPISESKYDQFSDKLLFSSIVEEYKEKATEYNQILEKKLTKAKQIYNKELNKKKHNQEIEFEKGRWRREKTRRKEIESEFNQERGLRLDLESKLEAEKGAHDRILKQVDSLNLKLEGLENLGNRQIAELQQELKRYMGSVNKLFVQYLDLQKSEKSKYEQKIETIASDLASRIDSYQKLEKQLSEINNKLAEKEKHKPDKKLKKEIYELNKKIDELTASGKRAYKKIVSGISDKVSECESTIGDMKNKLDHLAKEQKKSAHMVMQVNDKVIETADMIYDVRENQDFMVEEIVEKVISYYEDKNKQGLFPNFIKSVAESIPEPATYQILNLKKAALGRFGNHSYTARLTKIIDLTKRLPISDHDADIEFLVGFQQAMRLSFQKGDLKYAMENANLSKKLAKNAVKSVQTYVAKCIGKYEEISKTGALLESA